MKLRKGKNLIISLLCAMVMLLTAFSCIKVFGDYDIIQKNPDADVSTYTFKDWSDTDWEDVKEATEDNYNNYTKFIVDDGASFRTFAMSVAKWDCDYSGKTITLTNNVSYYWAPVGVDHDYTGQYINFEDCYPFKGTFNGAGYKITISSKVISVEDAAGIFGYTEGATIKNLNVSTHFRFSRLNAYNQYVKIGALVGRAHNTKIDNVMVSKFHITNDTTDDNGNYGPAPETGTTRKFIGGIVGTLYNNCEITNCYVTNYMLNINDSNSSGAAYDSYITGFVHDIDNNSTITNSVISNGEISNSKFDNWTITHANDYNAGKVQYKLTTDSKVQTDLYCNGSNNKFSIDPFRSAYWYDPPNTTIAGFNDGVPYLKTFIGNGTKCYNFKTSNVQQGTVSVQGNTHGEFLGTGYENAFMLARKTSDFPVFNESRLKSKTITLSGDSITISANTQQNSGYKFVKWTPSTETKTVTLDNGKSKIYTFIVYTAQFEREKYTLTFKPIAFGDKIFNPKIQTIDVTFGQEITLSVVGNKIFIGGKEVYVLEKQYCFDKMTSTDRQVTITEKSIKVNDLGEDGNDNIIVDIKLKTYGLEVSG